VLSGRVAIGRLRATSEGVIERSKRCRLWVVSGLQL